jgi:tetratricopeptide (TPR) repeat protein
MDKAMNAYQKAIDTDPTYAKPYVNLGNCYQKKGNTQMAQTLFQKAISLDPTLKNLAK